MSDLLIDAQSLQQVLSDPNWHVIDVRYSLADPDAGQQQYLDGHIPGAYFLDQGKQLAGHSTGKNGRHPLPDRQALQQVLQGYDITTDSNIVIYDHSDGSFAVRAWWLLRWLGCTQVRILDGGMQAWRDAGGPLQSGAGLVAPDAGAALSQTSNHEQAATAAMSTVTAQDVLACVSDDSRLIMDARAPERYRGETEPMDPVAGHIPGALNRPISSNVQPDGRFKPAARLRDEFNTLLGERRPDQVIHYCGSGITACHNVFAMEVAGLGGAALYPGSWSEWCSDTDRPVATG